MGIVQAFILAVGGVGGALIVAGAIIRWRKNGKRKDRKA